MSHLHRNVVANFAGQGVTAAMALLLVPFYVKLLGIESYGLIGFFAMLQTAFQILDLGLSQTMNREMARYSVAPDKAVEQRDFVRTIEVGYWAIGAVVGLLVIVLSPLVANHWFKPGALSPRTIEQAVAVMGGVAALRWPLSIYEGGLMGLQRQVLLNGVRIAVAVLGGVGALVVLMLTPTITSYFLWQMFVAAVNVAMIAWLLWRSLPVAQRRPVFDRRLLYSNWRFAAGMSGISVSAIVLTQLDKVLLSRMLPLEMFGYYTLAGIVSGVVPMLFVAPVFNAAYPRFTALVALGDQRELARLYHSVTQLMAVLAVSVSAVLGFLSFDILKLWTGSASTASYTAPIVSILVIGMALNALMTVPFALQISHGWTGIGLRINIGLAVSLVPALIFLTNRFGAAGGAATWALLNALYMAFGVPLTHRRLLRGEMGAWFLRDIIGPAAVACVIAAIGGHVTSRAASPAAKLLTSGLVAAVTLLGAAFAAPLTRGILHQYVPRLWQAR